MSDATGPAMASKSPLFREYAKEPTSISPLLLSLSNSYDQGESKPLLRKENSSNVGRRIDRDHHPPPQLLIYTDLKASVAESNKRHSGRRHLDGRLKAVSVRSNIIRRYDRNSVDISLSRESEEGEQYMPTRGDLKQRRTNSTQQARNGNNKLITRHSMISNLESVGNGILWSLVLLPILITMGMFMLSQINKDKTTVIKLPFSKHTFTMSPNERVHHDHDHIHISRIAPTSTSNRFSFDLHQGRVEYLGYIKSYLTITPDAMDTLRQSSAGCTHTLLVEAELVILSPASPLQGNNNTSNSTAMLPVTPLLLLSSEVVPIAAANSFYGVEETTTVTPVIIPLPIITFDRPNIFFNLMDHSGQDTMKVRYTVQWIVDGETDATVSDALRSSSTSIPSSISSPAPISITVMTQNTSNLWIFALVQLTASIALLTLLAYYITSIVSYSRQLLLSEQQQLQQRHHLLHYSKEGSCDDGRSVGATFMHYIIPEQYTVIALLSLLVLWVGPLQSMCLLCMLHGIKVSTHMLFITALIKDLSHFGLYCCLLTYIDGLGHRTAARDSSDDDVRLAQLTKQFTDISSYRSLRSVYDPFVDTTTTTTTSSSSSAASAVKSTETRRSDIQQQYDFWRRDDAACVQSSLLRLKRLDHINLLQSLYVVSHHPFSIEFLEFVFYKLLLLVVTCLLVVLYWFLVTTNIIIPTDNDVTVRWQLTTEQLNGSFTCVEIALFCAHMLWIFLILQSLLGTGHRLKRTIFMRSRFRQLAFRLLVFQGNTSLLLFLIVYSIWYVTFQPGLYEGVHFPSLYALLSFHHLWLQQIGFYRSFISCGFPLAYLDVESVVFLTSIICTIMYCMLPPAMLVLDRYGNVLNTNQHSFVTLCKYIPPTKDLSRDRSYQYAKMKVMRHLLRLMTVDDASGSYSVFMKLYLASIHDKKTNAEEEEETVFCLETALILLEVCYQTYFPLTRDETVVESPPQVRGSYGAIIPQQHTINISSSGSSGSFKLITPPSRSERRVDSISSRRALNPFDDDDDDVDDNDRKDEGNEKGKRTHIEDTIASAVKGVPSRSMNPFDPTYIDIIDDDATKMNKTKKGEEVGVDSTMPTTNPAMGPKLNVSSLGFQLKASFACQTFSTFGILCTCDNTIVVSFRGSQAANISTDLKFVQMALPRLKRPMSFFVRTLKLLSSSGGSYSNSGSKKRHSLSEEFLIDGDGGVYDDDDDVSDDDDDNDDNDSVKIDFSPEKMDDFQSDDDEDMQDGVENDDTNYFDTQDVHNFSSLSTKANLFLAKSKKIVKQKVSDLGTKVPLVNQSFARVHVGFWEAYSSIREDYMRAVIKAIYLHRKEFMERSRSSVSASPSSAFLYSCDDEELSSSSSSSSSTLKNNRQQQQQQQQSFSNLNSILDIYFCGHSLGAAIASLAALELASNMDLIMEALCREDIFEQPRAHASLLLPSVLSYPVPQLSLYMYGSPRIGNARFAYYIRRKVKAIYRIQVNGDIVAMLPKFIGFYRHIGTAIIIDDDDAGNIIVNPSIIESYMLLRNTGSFLNHSLEVYRSCLEACFDKFELSEYLTQELK